MGELQMNIAKIIARAIQEIKGEFKPKFQEQQEQIEGLKKQI